MSVPPENAMLSWRDLRTALSRSRSNRSRNSSVMSATIDPACRIANSRGYC